jgi:hypothetical protein
MKTPNNSNQANAKEADLIYHTRLMIDTWRNLHNTTVSIVSIE